MKDRIKGICSWCSYHGFPTKVVGNVVYWQTNFQTGEFHVDTLKQYWHDVEYFDTIKEDM